jgi:hypothetical protein
MNEENTKKLIDRFDFYTAHNPLWPDKSWPMSFDCNDGWMDIIWRLSLDLEKMVAKVEWDEDTPFTVVQVKEKWGHLCYYISSGTDEMFERINQAEVESTKICEICSKLGKLRTGRSWYVTLCDECAKPQEQTFFE